MKPWPHSQRPKGSPVFCFANRCALPIDHKYDAPCARRRLIYATRLQPLLYCERTGSSTSTSPSSARWRFTPASGSSLKFTVSTRTSMDPVPPLPSPPPLWRSALKCNPLHCASLPWIPCSYQFLQDEELSIQQPQKKKTIPFRLHLISTGPSSHTTNSGQIAIRTGPFDGEVGACGTANL